MKTNFKSIIPEEYQKFGVCFKSEHDVSTQYLIELCDGVYKGNVLVKIYTTDNLENYFKTDGLINGSIIGVPEHEIELIAEVNLCGKYFFLKLNNELQLYYDDKKYYNEDCSTDSVTSLMEAINFSIEYGLNESGIVPY